ncbi:3'-5'-exoribonuclease [Coemansia sp. RSA 551]|nr:3'-5'-exoribonuclease [Coemansia sp. RSA 551]KAJ2256912.1 3'-5'-exoribonuclease [Coemansia sp. RSA 454]
MSGAVNDRRRINGPARSVEPIYTATVLDSVAKGRSDGRGLDHMRPIYAKAGPISDAQTTASASGSAFYEQGSIRISCAVYGPRSARKPNARRAHFVCDFQYAPFACSKRSPTQSTDEHETSLWLSNTVGPAIRLEMYPKSSIDAYVTVIESDGKMPTLAATINCISLALADAGIEMYDTVAACSMGLRDSQWIVDCTHQENAECSVLVAYMPSVDEVTGVLQTGKTTLEVHEQGVQLCTNVCVRVYAVICRALQASVE